MALGAGVAVATWPGAMNIDALSQIGQVRSGRYNDWHSGVLVPMWRPLYALGLSAGWVYLGSVVLLAFGLYKLLASAMGHRTAGFVTAGLLAYPPVLGLVVYWGRDQWFVGALLAAAASLVAMADSGDRHARATIAFTVSVWVMLASRQNAPPAAFVLVVAAMVHGGRGARQSWLTRLGPGRYYGALRAIALGLTAGAVVAIMLLSQEAIRRVAGVSHVHPEQQTLFYDLAAISIDTGDNTSMCSRRAVSMASRNWVIDRGITQANGAIVDPCPRSPRPHRHRRLDPSTSSPTFHSMPRIPTAGRRAAHACSRSR